MPKPRKGESKNDFVGRCISDVVGEGKDRDQAIAQCLGIWEQEKGSKLEVALVGMTSTDDDHRHSYVVDDDGNGKTTSTMPDSEEDHEHQIQDWKVLEADDHVHTINRKTNSEVKQWIKEDSRLYNELVELINTILKELI